MHLKRLELYGFKSFANKTEIDFEGGITAIVGPNGSGKSNIADALRWVLGEQSVKTLRGSKMDDVIFAGTANRKPLGYAEVSLVLDNKEGDLPIDYDEVSVTRRVFRSGESEYYINKTSCRLKDIRELFMDTGVGKDGYSIIGQGKIDEILSSKSDDRRIIFEEAAGIVKYKSRKEESEKKLSKVKENLTRLNDIINELQAQMIPLEHQSAKAKEYIELSEKLKILEVNVYIREIERLKAQVLQIESQKQLVEKQLEYNKNEKDKIEKRYNNIKNKIEEIDSKIEKIQELKYNTENNVEKLRGNLKLCKEKLNFSKKEQDRILREIDSLKLKVNKIDNEKISIQNEKQIIESRLKDIIDKYEIKRRELEELITEINEYEKNIEEKKGNIIETLNLISEKKSNMNSIISFNQSIKKRIEQINNDILEIKSKKCSLEDNLKLLKKDLVDLDLDINMNYEKKNSLLKEKDLCEMKVLELSKKIDMLKGQLQGKISNYKLLNEMKNDYEGFYKSVKNVLLAAKKDKTLGHGVRGAVAELIAVDKKYEKAVEIALGASVQNIVTDTEEDAKRIITYLKSNKLGRATFLPISSIRGKKLLPKERALLSCKGAIGVASEIVHFDNLYKNIVEYLLGRVLIVENVDVGVDIAKKCNYSIKIVSLDGDVINPGGSITGGSYKHSSTNLIGRERQLKDIEKEIDDLKNDILIQNNKFTLLKNIIKEKGDDINALDEKINKLNVDKINIKNDYNNTLDSLKNMDVQLSKYEKEKKELVCELEDTKNKLKVLEKELDSLNNQNNNIQINIDEKIKSFQEKKEKKDILDKNMTELKVTIASYQEKINSYQESLNKLEKDKLDIVININKKNDEYNKIIHQIETLEVNINDILAKSNELSAMVIEYDVNLTEIKNEKNNLLQSFYKEKDRFKNINDIIKDLEDSLKTLEIKYTKDEMLLDNYVNKLWEEYELSYQMALKYKKEINNISKSQQEIRVLKNKIKSLGNINLDSIKEFERVNDRFKFIKEQENDLLAAQNSLRKVIKDMEMKMKEQFSEKFQIIRENFNMVFNKLFGGGKADIFLEDEGDILNSGIEIIAQPPGKKLKNLSLMSGGERALTAIALLFAILHTKPTPFCILDEIEAALDDANVYRFADYLREFSKKTQFIVITHRKGTMESVDSMYGVTMQEKGVSKIISVKLPDKSEEKVS